MMHKTLCKCRRKVTNSPLNIQSESCGGRLNSPLPPPPPLPLALLQRHALFHFALLVNVK